MINQSPLEFVTEMIRELEPLNGTTEVVTLDTKLRDLNLDSLDLIELTMMVEDEYNVNFEDDDAERALKGTVRDLLCLIPGQELVYGRG